MNKSGRISLLAAWLCASSAALFGQPYVISTVAGGVMPATPGTAVSLSIGRPSFVVLDTNGNAYFSTSLNCVYELSTGGTLTRVAGICGAGGNFGDSGPATSALLGSPQGLAFDSSGNLYIADKTYGRVRQVSTNGTIITVAGGGLCCASGDNGPAVDAYMSSPTGIAVDTAGNLYIADSNSAVVREVGTNGIITTVAGNGSFGFYGDSGPATSAKLNGPRGVAVDNLGNLFIADMNNYRVREVSSGTITTVAGNGYCCSVDSGGPATSSGVYPVSVKVDGQGNLYIADQGNQRILKVAAGLTVSSLAGNGGYQYYGDGGAATSASINPSDMALTAGGAIYIADEWNYRIRQVSTGGIINTVAGNGSDNYSGDTGPAIAAGVGYPQGVAVDSNGNFYIADSQNNRVRKVSAGGSITTVAGTGVAGFFGDNAAATSAQLSFPEAVLVDTIGNLYIADTNNCRVREVSPGGTIRTIAGNGGCASSGDGQQATSAQVGGPAGLALDSLGNLYISDQWNQRIRQIAPGGVINTVAGNGTVGYYGDNGPATSAELYAPSGLAVDSNDNLYIADSGNNAIREVSTTSWTITTVAGNGNCCFSGDGAAATGAQLSSPAGVAVDASGNLYIADTNDNRIRKVSGGIINTIAGTGGNGYWGDGGPAINAQLANPMGLALNSAGEVYVADQSNYAIRLLQPGVTLAEFSDVPLGATYFDAANLMFLAGVTTGCLQSNNPATRQFCPNDDVTRQEMAAFIVRAVTGTEAPAIYNHTPYFTDVPVTNSFFPHIQKLMDLGITTGCGGGMYCPTATIPRWEMAMFMVRARLMLHGAPFTTATTPYFTDVPTNVEGNGMPFPFIQRSFEEHITNGCGGGDYCPDEVVTRGQMASFIMRGLFNETMVLAPGAPVLTGVSPNAVALALGSAITVTIAGTNTSFQSGDTVTVPSGMLTVTDIVVNSATSISATLTVNSTAVAGPQALVVATGGANITLPLAVQVGVY